MWLFMENRPVFLTVKCIVLKFFLLKLLENILCLGTSFDFKIQDQKQNNFFLLLQNFQKTENWIIHTTPSWNNTALWRKKNRVKDLSRKYRTLPRGSRLLGSRSSELWGRWWPLWLHTENKHVHWNLATNERNLLKATPFFSLTLCKLEQRAAAGELLE